MTNVSRWQSGVVASIMLVAAGVLAGSPPLILAAIVPLTYLGYGALSSVPEPQSALNVDRQVTPQRPLPGETVHVEVTVTNRGSRAIPDLRLIEGVPSDLAVIDGEDRVATTLRAGESQTLEYTLQPRLGAYAFDAVAVRVRSLSGAAVETVELTASGVETLECTVPVEDVPIRRETIPHVGAIATDSGGPGYEFHSARQYRHGDPLRRIDWRRYARTGELGTILFREQEAATVVVIIDGREQACAAAAPGRPDGSTLSTYAGLVMTTALADAGHRVGIAALGVQATTPGVFRGPPAYLEPGTGPEHTGKIARVCETVAANANANANTDANTSGVRDSDRSSGMTAERAPLRTDGMGTVEYLQEMVPSNTQFVFCTPALEVFAVEIATGLRRRGAELTVLAPDVTTQRTVGARLESIRREARLTRLRQAGCPVIDWDPETPLSKSLERGGR